MQVRNLAILALAGLAAALPRLGKRGESSSLISSTSGGDTIPSAPQVIAPSLGSDPETTSTQVSNLIGASSSLPRSLLTPTSSPQVATSPSVSLSVPSLPSAVPSTSLAPSSPIATPSLLVTSHSPSSSKTQTTLLVSPIPVSSPAAGTPPAVSPSKPLTTAKPASTGAIAGTSTAAGLPTGTAANGAAASSLEALLISIAPWTASCGTSQGNKQQQCATAAQAAPAIVNSFTTYGLTTNNEKAAVVSLMLFESVQFKYNRPINPEPGKGTRAMLSGMYTSKYAASIPSLQGKTGGDALDSLTADVNLDFGSAAWFLMSQCGPAVVTALKNGKQAEWEAYLKGCVRVSPADGNRTAWYTATVKALGGYRD